MASKSRPLSDDAAITWIHLSDFHAGQRGDAAWHQVEQKLRENVTGMVRRLGVPDLVLFTGDLVNRGGRDEHGNDEYAGVDRLLDRLNEWVGHELPVVAVPGNHDLVRPKETETWRYAALEHYEQQLAFHEGLWRGDPGPQELVRELFPHYNEWSKRRVVEPLEQAGWEVHVSPRMPGDLSVVVEKDGLRLHLVGLNTAWTHLSDKAGTRGLQLPVDQFHAALPVVDSASPLDWFHHAHASFLLTHHPPSWLSESAKASYYEQIYPPERFTLALFGHMHEGRSEVVNNSGTGTRAFYQAPSLFGLEHYGTSKEPRSFGYTWGRLTARGEVRIWPQKGVRRNDGSLAFDRDQGFGPEDDELGGTVLVEGRAPREEPSESKAGRSVGIAGITAEWSDPIPRDELKRYLAKARSLHEFVRLIGFKTKGRLAMQLHELYVPLDAVIDRGGRGCEIYASAEIAERSKAHDAAMRREEISLANAFGRAREMKRRGLVLLGDPGSGKTTHLKQVLLKVVRDGAESIGLPAHTVPAFLPLRKFQQREAGLPAFIDQSLRGPALNMKPDFGQRLCERGKLLLLLDGLDEVASAEERAEVSRWIEAALSDMPESYILVSCRYAGYTGAAELANQFLELHLRPFTDEQMRTFVTNWYASVERELSSDPEQAAVHAQKSTGELLRILESSEFTTVGKRYQMTRNPLLLTTLCLVHRDLGRLPHARSKLYEESVAVLLERWRDRMGEGVPSLTADEAVEVLRPVARWMHGERRERATKAELAAPVGEGLAKLRDVQVSAEEFLRQIRDDSGLLTGWSGNEYGFMHLGFQEFLAAQRLRNEGLKDQRLFEALAERFGDSWWQEVILLMLALRNPGVFEQFMREVVRQPEFPRWARSQVMGMVFDEAAEVSAAPFLELLRAPESEGLLDQRIATVELLRRRMPDVLSDSEDVLHGLVSETPTGRFESEQKILPTARAPRGGVELVRVPAGRFLMGSPEGEEGRDVYFRHLKPEQREGRVNPESPQHEVTLASFYLAKTPVTNAQYAEFLKANPDAAKPEHWGDRQYNQLDQPVVGVSWHDAQAYCEWAGLTLPTEAQWEYACRAGSTTRYWSGDGEEDLARVGWYGGNSDGRLHPVGEKEPNAFGLYDVHGNVWEWCLDNHGSYETSPRSGDGLRHEPVGDAIRVVRGGAWDYVAGAARSAIRFRLGPDYRWYDVGFRPVQGID